MAFILPLYSHGRFLEPDALLCPPLITIQTMDEDGHRLIRRARLKLIVGTLPLFAGRTLPPVRGSGKVALQLDTLLLRLLIHEFLPLLRK